MSDRRTCLVGAFEADAWAGIVVCLGPGRGAAVRLRVVIEGAPVEPRELFARVHEVGPHEPEGRYARVSFDLRPGRGAPAGEQPPLVADGEATLTWEWARVGACEMAGRVSAARPVRVWLLGVAPWDWVVFWEPAAGGLVATVAGGERVRLDVLAGLPSHRNWGRNYFPAADTARNRACVALDLEPGTPALFRLAVEPPVPRPPLPENSSDPDALDPDPENSSDPDFWAGAIDRAAAGYEARRVRVSGAWDGLAASITQNLHWTTLLQPERGRRYVPAGRRWIFPTPDGARDHWTIFAWDGFFNALLASLDDHALASDMVEAVLDTQYPDGLVPNWRSRLGGTPDRSQPPVGAFLTLRIVQRSGDVDLARRALPRLERWHAWWSGDATRPGRRRPSGLFAWGSDVDRVNAWVPPWEREASHRQKAAWESGQDDLPNWDEAAWDAATNTLALDCVDLSALVALDAECLAALHEITGSAARAASLRREHARLCALIDAHLWDETRGVYADRLPDGRFSPRLAASNFYPLLAGVAMGDRLRRALRVLCDPGQFWGTWVVPTISRRDAAHADQQYWRGTIWPPTNFLIYEALRRVRADEAAAHLAARSVALLVGDWRARQVCRENFSSVDGTGGGHLHQSWGPLFAWTGLAEFADVTPWDGLRLGSAYPPPVSVVERLQLAGHEWRIALAPDAMSVARDGREWFTADAPVCLRHVSVEGGRWRALASAVRDARVRLAGGTALTVPGRGPHLAIEAQIPAP